MIVLYVDTADVLSVQSSLVGNRANDIRGSTSWLCPTSIRNNSMSAAGTTVLRFYGLADSHRAGHVQVVLSRGAAVLGLWIFGRCWYRRWLRSLRARVSGFTNKRAFAQR